MMYVMHAMSYVSFYIYIYIYTYIIYIYMYVYIHIYIYIYREIYGCQKLVSENQESLFGEIIDQ